jgi:spermidine synthase
MSIVNRLIFETDTKYSHYQVWDTIYNGRNARVLYSGQRHTAQSGLALDGKAEMLFDYNERLLELVIGMQPKRILLIGGGVYTLPMRLLSELSETYLDVVEIDSGLDEIAIKHFGLTLNSRLRIIHDDGRKYLDNNAQAYDIIIVDAFIQADIPSSLETSDAIAQYKRNLTDNGLFAMNIISAYRGLAADALKREIRTFESYFSKVDVYPAGPDLSFWLPQNIVLIAQVDDSKSVSEYLRYPPLERE